MPLESIKNVSKKLQLLDKKMEILIITIRDSFRMREDNLFLDRDIEDKDIQKEYYNWKQDLLIKYYNPRS
jgi:hypothetical protein